MWIEIYLKKLFVKNKKEKSFLFFWKFHKNEKITGYEWAISRTYKDQEYVV